MKKTINLLLILLTAVFMLTSCNFQKLSLDQTELEMTVGDSVELSAGDAVKVNWKSSDDKIASVNAGTVSAKSAGTAVITASLENGEEATCNVTVNDKLITEITLSSTNTRIEVGKTIQLIAVYSPSDASQTTLRWESADTNIAVVNNEGFVVGVAKGVTMITCKSENGIEASCAVSVNDTATTYIPPATLPPATEKPAPAQNNAQNYNNQNSAASSYSGSYIFPDSSWRRLTNSEIAATLRQRSGTPVSGSFAQDAINEIYARNGYIFRTDYIQAYYESQPWYRPNPYFDSSFNSIEEYNINLLSDY